MALNYNFDLESDKYQALVKYIADNTTLVQETNAELPDLFRNLAYDLLNTTDSEGTTSKYLTAPLRNSFLLFNSIDATNDYPTLFNVTNFHFWTLIAKSEITGYSKKHRDFVLDLILKAAVFYRIHSYVNLNPLLTYPELTTAEFNDLAKQLAANPTSVKDINIGFYNWKHNNKNKDTLPYADSLLDHAVLLYVAENGEKDPQVVEIAYKYLSRYGFVAGLVGAFAQQHRSLRRKIGFQIKTDLLAIDEVNDYSLLTGNFVYVMNEYVSNRTDILDKLLSAARKWQDDTSGKPFHQVVGQGDDLDQIFNYIDYHTNLAVYETELDAGGSVQDAKTPQILDQLRSQIPPLTGHQEALALAKEFYNQTLNQNNYTPESWCSTRIKQTPKTYTESLASTISDLDQAAKEEKKQGKSLNKVIRIVLLLIIAAVGYYIGEHYIK